MSQHIQSDASTPRVRRFRFLIKADYDDHELSDLFDTLADRGADCRHVPGGQVPGWYIVEIPSEVGRWIPFYKTVKDCPSVESVRGVGRNRVIYQCEPEG
jgi:hypothetical protein